ncbi:hypothetical protein [Pasteurella sp. PK-2025]|uniref:hypothetical protein n=1 Tax=Pasteurella sp. PK-2025 TaxID=3413133 RepID=UPI003C7441D8
MKKSFNEGDLFFISEIKVGFETLSLHDGNRIGKLIYISSLFKDMIGFLPSKETFKEIPTNLENIEFLDYVIYTGNSELKRGKWSIIGHSDVTEREILLTTRITGNHLMIKDQEIRFYTEEDRQNYPRQGIAGLGAVYYYLNNLEKII